MQCCVNIYVRSSVFYELLSMVRLNEELFCLECIDPLVMRFDICLGRRGESWQTTPSKYRMSNTCTPYATFTIKRHVLLSVYLCLWFIGGQYKSYWFGTITEGSRFYTLANGDVQYSWTVHAAVSCKSRGDSALISPHSNMARSTNLILC